MDLIVELVGSVVFAILGAFFGACFGVVWPAKTPQWARWQKFGILLAIISFTCGVLVFLIDGGPAWKQAEPVLLLTSATAFVGYLLVGNICRKFHE